MGGPYRYTVGRVLTNRVTSPMTMVMTIGNDGDLAWQWGTNYWVDVAVVGSGSVTPNEGWCRANTPVLLTATPGSGFTFDHWSGDVPPGQAGNVSINITPAAPLHIAAHFRAIPHDETIILLR